MGRTRARRRARPVSPPQFGLRFTDIFLDNERPHSGCFIVSAASRPQQAEAHNKNPGFSEEKPG